MCKACRLVPIVTSLFHSEHHQAPPELPKVEPKIEPSPKKEEPEKEPSPKKEEEPKVCFICMQLTLKRTRT